METKHTPGPWNVCENWDDDHMEVGSESTPVCTVFKDNNEDIHNARLIAAAPDLLEALKNLMSASSHTTFSYEMAWKAAEDAIEKATL